MVLLTINYPDIVVPSIPLKKYHVEIEAPFDFNAFDLHRIGVWHWDGELLGQCRV